MASKYILSQPDDSFSDFEAQIETQLEAGFNLTELEYVEDKWLGIFSTVESESVYVSSSDDAEFSSSVNTAIEEGHTVVDLERVNDTWIGLLSKTDHIKTAYFSAADFEELESQVDIYRDKGGEYDFQKYDLSNIEYSGSEWTATFDHSYGSDSVYDVSDDLTGFKAVVESQADAGFGIGSVEYAEDRWVGVFRESDLETSVFFVGKNRQEFDTELEQRQEDGFELTDLEIVGDRWVGVFSESAPVDSDTDLNDLNQTLTDYNTIRAITNSGLLY